MSLLEKRINTDSWFSSDAQFNHVYPTSIQSLAQRHWTPLVVAKKAAGFLAAEKNVKILDIGSGVGKFCLAAAHYKPDAFYYGIEQRKRLVSHAEVAKEILRTENVSFINGNFTQLDFRDYDHFYFYNSFYENIAGTEKIDKSIDYSLELYNYYNRYLYKQLEQKPPGTRVASFHSLEDEIPQGYHIVGSEINDLLKFWIKI
ncbi:MAG: class I SAM-dependent methyltransferase [Bacteroidota bacterium]